MQVFDIVRIKIKDSVPKAINLLIFERVIDRTLVKLVLAEKRKLLHAGEKELEKIMGWTEEGEKKKEALTTTKDAIQESLEALNGSNKRKQGSWGTPDLSVEEEKKNDM